MVVGGRGTPRWATHCTRRLPVCSAQRRRVRSSFRRWDSASAGARRPDRNPVAACSTCSVTYARPSRLFEPWRNLATTSFGPLSTGRGRGSRPMPTRWPKNLRLRFDLRACPVRRIMKPLTTSERPHLPATTLSKGKEVDAFQVAAARALDTSEPILARDRIYIEWLVERLAPQPERPQAVALVPGSVRVDAYRSVRLLRRPRSTSGYRSRQWLTRPDVRFTGLLDITDPAAFPALLAGGVGRHCGFGFGMLLLRPA